MKYDLFEITVGKFPASLTTCHSVKRQTWIWRRMGRDIWEGLEGRKGRKKYHNYIIISKRNRHSVKIINYMDEEIISTWCFLYVFTQKSQNYVWKKKVNTQSSNRQGWTFPRMNFITAGGSSGCVFIVLWHKILLRNWEGFSITFIRKTPVKMYRAVSNSPQATFVPVFPSVHFTIKD